MIGIISYGVGNVRAFLNIYERFGLAAKLVKEPGDLTSVTHLVLPGVGSFDWAMERLNSTGLRPALDEAVCERRIPTLGVCVGMQILVESSEEGSARGLGWIDGACRKLRLDGVANIRLPHMGWNRVALEHGEPLFEGFDEEAEFYFLHSFHVVPRETEVAIGHTEYGERFVAAIRAGNVLGVQFHPEKSHAWGERLLVNFAGL